MSVEQAKQVLTDAGFYVGNLWSIRDVQDRYECDDETAQDILHDALTNEYIAQEIFSQIIDFAECEGLEEIEQVN